MKYAAVILCLAVVLSSAEVIPADAVPWNPNLPHAVRAKNGDALVGASQERASLETGLAALSPEERANAELVIVTIDQSPELKAGTRAIEQLWNTGQYDLALSRLRELGNRVDPMTVQVGMNWRRPLETSGVLDWDGNVKVGTRDSVFFYGFDYSVATGNLFVSAARRAGTQTALTITMSTDLGSTWLETYNGYWGSNNAISYLGGQCHGDHFYSSYLHSARPESLLAQWYKTSDGTIDTFANGDQRIGMTGSTAGDTLATGSMCSAEDLNPGSRVYAFAGTRHGNVVGSWSAAGTIWNSWNMGYLSGSYTTGLASTFNLGYTNRHIWLAYDYAPTDTTHYPLLAWVWVGDSIGGTYINLPSWDIHSASGLAARHDSVVWAYEHNNKAELFYPREMMTRNNGANWYWSWIPGDTTVQRELPDICARRTSDLGAVYREYSTPRSIPFTYTSMTGYGWSTPVVISDSIPWATCGPQVQALTPGLFGAIYLDFPHADLWYNRSDFGTGIADLPTPIRANSGLAVLPLRGGARLAFSNPVQGKVSLRVFDASGRLVSHETRHYSAGAQVWDCDLPGNGIYFATLDGIRHLGSAKLSAVK